ncbi:MAG: hypothetical protein HY279_10375 [Nitrospinae bacterium]|nr:hypothetical protein [Nitrospinota bacterium]
MTKKQRESVSKYLYDISKGIFLIVVVGNFMKGEWDIFSITTGIWAAIVFFLWAYIIEGGVEDE